MTEKEIDEKVIEGLNKFLSIMEAERKITQDQFDRLVIRRFKEMVVQSSSPEMFENIDEDIEELIKTRKL